MRGRRRPEAKCGYWPFSGLTPPSTAAALTNSHDIYVLGWSAGQRAPALGAMWFPIDIPPPPTSGSLMAMERVLFRMVFGRIFGRVN